MKERGEQKPVWITELGCYGEDEPAITPFALSDESMQQALHGNEREASEWVVKFAALFFANSGGKIFFHAGTCSEINTVDTGGVFFKYGGVPRKIYPVVSAMANLLPPEAVFEKTEVINGKVNIHWFKTNENRLGVVWSQDGEKYNYKLPENTKALDIFGNLLPDSQIVITETPNYLIK